MFTFGGRVVVAIVDGCLGEGYRDTRTLFLDEFYPLTGISFTSRTTLSVPIN